MDTVWLSPSGIATYENCPRAYFFDRILKIKLEQRSCALGFGGALSKAMEAFALGTVAGSFVDPVPIFQDQWKSFTRSTSVKYGKYDSEEGILATGTKLMEDFPKAWEAEGLTVALDGEGNPMVERKLVVDLGKATRLVTKLDVLAFDRDFKLLLIDQKSTKSVTDIRFALMGEQLTAYQLTVTAHAEKLALPPIGGLAYWELIKRNIPKKTGKGPTVEPISSVEPRSDQDVAAFVAKTQGIAQRVRNRDFPKTPRMSWNTPCLNCDFLDLCSQRRIDGYVFPTEEAKEAALKVAA